MFHSWNSSETETVADAAADLFLEHRSPAEQIKKLIANVMPHFEIVFTTCITCHTLRYLLVTLCNIVSKFMKPYLYATNSAVNSLENTKKSILTLLFTHCDKKCYYKEFR